LNNTMIDTGKKMAVDVAIAAGGITGGKTLYGWAKDAAGNVSTSVSDSVDISIGSRLEVTGALTVGTPP